MYKKIVMLVFCILNMLLHAQSSEHLQADFIIFSYDRPLQLYALLESTEQLVTGLRQIFVIYRTSALDFDRGYALVKERFARVVFIQQKREFARDFKELLLKALKKATSGYVLFGVDDIVVKDYIDISDAIRAMQTHNVYGCFLRLCPDINYMYSWQRPQVVPQLQKVEEGYVWRFCEAAPISDWAYAHTVDMTIYKKSDIMHEIIHHMDFYNPNTFEAQWNQERIISKVRQRYGFCYEATKIVNVPMNIVQNTHTKNPHMTCEELKPKELLKLFLDGYKMDINPLFGIENHSAHIEYQPTFVMR